MEGPSGDEPVRAAARAACAAWPDVRVDEETLARWIDVRVRDEPDAAAALARMKVDDLALACAAAAGEPRALEVFEERCMAPAGAVLARSGEAPDAVEEAKQALFERLFVDGKITEYGARGPLASWVRVALARIRSNVRRREKKHTELDEGRVPAAFEVEPELAIVRRRYGEPFNAAFREAFAALSPEERTILRLHFVDGLNLDRLAVVLGVSRATAGRRMLQTRTRIFDETLRLLRTRLALSTQELESVLAIVRSGLEVSLGALVREPA